MSRSTTLSVNYIYAYYVFRRSEMRTMASGASQDLCSPLEGIGQRCALPRIKLTGVVLDPSLLVAARLDRQPLFNLGTDYSPRS